MMERETVMFSCRILRGVVLKISDVLVANNKINDDEIVTMTAISAVRRVSAKRKTVGMALR